MNNLVGCKNFICKFTKAEKLNEYEREECNEKEECKRINDPIECRRIIHDCSNCLNWLNGCIPSMYDNSGLII